ncbi:MAG: hypothetical protein IJ287_02425 [Methanobrevibacter sp.]|nr:hypothetical protein [Methanobrevibacter sp.]
MVIENQKNRDLFFKICFMHFLNHILKVLGIDEEIEDTIATEYISVEKKDPIRIFDRLLDFAAITKSGKIIIFEFKKDILRKKDLKQIFDYYRQIYCKEKTDVIAILIVISKYGKIKDFTELDITFHPEIIKTKLINKQKDLKTIREKFNGNIVLTSMECSLLIALPLFDIKESEAEIVEEMCSYIECKRNCIPKDKIEEVTLGMYFNILEYIPQDRQDELMEMIDMNDIKSRGDLAKFRKEEKKKGIKQGIKQGMKQGMKQGIEKTIPRLLDSMTPQEISTEFDIKLERVLEIKKSCGK